MVNYIALFKRHANILFLISVEEMLRALPVMWKWIVFDPEYIRSALFRNDSLCGGRLKKVKGMSCKRRFQPFHRWNRAALSIPAIQWNFVFLNRVLRCSMVCNVYWTFKSCSILHTCILGCWTNFRVRFRRCLKLSFFCFNGFWGLTSHQIASNLYLRRAVKAMCIWPEWGGLNVPPNKPTCICSHRIALKVWGEGRWNCLSLYCLKNKGLIQCFGQLVQCRFNGFFVWFWIHLIAKNRTSGVDGDTCCIGLDFMLCIFFNAGKTFI